LRFQRRGFGGCGLGANGGKAGQGEQVLTGAGVEFQGVEQVGAGKDEEAEGNAFGRGGGEIGKNAGGGFDGSSGGLAVHGEIDGGAATGAAGDDGDVGELGEIGFGFRCAVFQQPGEQCALVRGERADIGDGLGARHGDEDFLQKGAKEAKGILKFQI